MNIFITGSTGLIGSTLVKNIIDGNDKSSGPTNVYALVRDEEKAKNIFREKINSKYLHIIKGTVEKLPSIATPIDYIVHAASNTSSKAFVNAPVEVIDTAIDGTRNVLKLAQDKHVKKMVFLSTMEVYGYPPKGHMVSENEIGALSPLSVRNSYPLSKIMCENLCTAYAAEYQVPVVIARLTQTFGPGVDIEHDGRIFAYFAHCVINKDNIVLKTKGETERCYLYTEDAVSAIKLLLEKGVPAEAYTIANNKTYCSISEMAELVAKYADINVKYDLQDTTKSGYANTLYMDLNTSKIENLGWKPEVNSLLEMYVKMIDDYRKQKEG